MLNSNYNDDMFIAQRRFDEEIAEMEEIRRKMAEDNRQFNIKRKQLQEEEKRIEEKMRNDGFDELCLELGVDLS
jgi:hypothetical protein